MSGELRRFLEDRRVRGSDGEWTHVGLDGWCRGKYFVSEEDKDRFFDLFIQVVVGGEPIALAETHGDIGPLVVDIDLRYQLGNSLERVYTQENVMDIVRLYQDVAKEFVVDCDPLCYVFEKANPMMHRDLLKDGIHLVFPRVITNPWVQFEIRRKVIEAYSERPIFENAVNSPEDIFDAAVIHRNAWLLVGSSKSLFSTRYFLSKTVDGTGVVSHNDISLERQIRECRIRYHPSTSECEYQSHVDVGALRRKYGHDGEDHGGSSGNTGSIPRGRDPVASVSENSRIAEYASALVDLLKPERFDDYQTWLEIGVCLYNVDENLLYVWDDASRVSPKYEPMACARKWATFHKGAMGIATLCRMAKEDDPDGYVRVRSESEVGYVERALSLTNRDVANLVHFRFREHYKCSDTAKKLWYKFENHRWKPCDGTTFIRNHVMEDLSESIFKAMEELRHRSERLEPGDEKTQVEKRQKQFEELYRMLGSRRFVDDVVHVCLAKFYDEQFIRVKDSNPHLMGFENGVLDLEHLEFRDGKVDDLVTLSTGNEFRWLSDFDGDPLKDEVIDFMQKVLPDQEIREYVLMLMASMLFGKNVEQKVHIWTGAGSNGKSTLVDLFERTLGEYACKLPTSLLTQRRAASSNASPELSRTVGRRFASLEEPENRDRINVGILKELSGGNRIQVRGLYQDPIEFAPQFKMVLCCNYLPEIPSADGGTWRRLRVVEFKSRFVDQPREEDEFALDRSIGMKLHKWKEVFMAILVDYFRTYKERLDVGLGVQEPEAVVKYTNDYQKRSDVVFEFVEERLVRTGNPSDRVLLDAVYLEYKSWYSENYNKVPVSKNEFKMELASKKIVVERNQFLRAVTMRVYEDS